MAAEAGTAVARISSVLVSRIKALALKSDPDETNIEGVHVVE
jgi:hypothetical protein